jgi:hypothetical protein
MGDYSRKKKTCKLGGKSKLKVRYDLEKLDSKSLTQVAEWLYHSYDINPEEILEKFGMTHVNSEHNYKTGFSAISMHHLDHLIILFPGTKNYQDCVNNAMVLGNFPTLQMRYDVEYFFDKSLANFISTQQHIPTKVYCLGHSLGAINADTAVAVFLNKPYHLLHPKNIKSITIENPGSLKLLSRFVDVAKLQKQCFEIFNYHKPNGINSTKWHVKLPHLVSMPHMEQEFNKIDSTHSHSTRILKKLFVQHAVESFRDPAIQIMRNDHQDHEWQQTSRVFELGRAVSQDAANMVYDTGAWCGSQIREYSDYFFGAVSAVAISTYDIIGLNRYLAVGFESENIQI